jgi:hypothetical protein
LVGGGKLIGVCLIGVHAKEFQVFMQFPSPGSNDNPFLAFFKNAFLIF